MNWDQIKLLFDILDHAGRNPRYKNIRRAVEAELAKLDDIQVVDKTEEARRPRAIPAAEIVPPYEAPPPDEPTPTITRRI